MRKKGRHTLIFETVKGVRYLNVGGQVICETATGTYTVNADGTNWYGHLHSNSRRKRTPSGASDAGNLQFRVQVSASRVGHSFHHRAANGQDIGLVIGVKTEFVRQGVP